MARSALKSLAKVAKKSVKLIVALVCVSRGDFFWPLGDEGHAVAAFVDAGFAAAQRAGAKVVLFGHQPGGVWAGPLSLVKMSRVF